MPSSLGQTFERRPVYTYAHNGASKVNKILTDEGWDAIRKQEQMLPRGEKQS